MTANQPLDGADRDWAEMSSPDDWGVRAVYQHAARELLARELERLAEEFEATRKEWREVDDRTIRSSALGHAVTRLKARAKGLRGQEWTP